MQEGPKKQKEVQEAKVETARINRSGKPTKSDIVALKEHFDKLYGRK